MADKSLAGSTVQASLLLNSNLIKEKVQADKGRLKTLLRKEPLKSNREIVEELFLATLGRLPSDEEQRLGVAQIERYRESGSRGPALEPAQHQGVSVQPIGFPFNLK